MTEPLFGVWVSGPCWPQGTWCTKRRRRLELPRHRAEAIAEMGRENYGDHTYEVRPILHVVEAEARS